MRLVGLTGTKGKTTTALLIRSLLEDAGTPAGYIGTNGVDYRDVHRETVNSTPESLDIYRYLREMLDAGVTACVMEISSQALWMERTRGLVFDTVLFTNLSRDHIGGVEHPDFRHYRTHPHVLEVPFDGSAPAAVAEEEKEPAGV
jgi:UDP-N-acetylmuramoyl-L-alanyl-D-glutamate--2,6-diaminopimelate ligase